MTLHVQFALQNEQGPLSRTHKNEFYKTIE